MKSRITSRKQKSYKIHEQSSDGEEVSHEEQQHQADFESKRPWETTRGTATKQDGDEDILESTEVSASKATDSRSEVQKVSEKTPSQNHQQKERARSHKPTKEFYRGQIVTTIEQAVLQVSSSSQTSPQVRSSPAFLVHNPRLRSKHRHARRTKFQQPRRRTWTTASQLPKLRRGFRTPQEQEGSRRQGPQHRKERQTLQKSSRVRRKRPRSINPLIQM